MPPLPAVTDRRADRTCGPGREAIRCAGCGRLHYHVRAPCTRGRGPASAALAQHLLESHNCRNEYIELGRLVVMSNGHALPRLAIAGTLRVVGQWRKWAVVGLTPSGEKRHFAVRDSCRAAKEFLNAAEAGEFER